jgi:hypothetical protein
MLETETTMKIFVTRSDAVKALTSRLAKSLALFALLCPVARTQDATENVTIHVHADQSDGSFRPIWNYWGYDEPNYTYTVNGKKLLGELAAVSPAPVYVRMHNLLTSGDGSASLKWGSTNAYTEDAAGNPVYNWAIVDRIFDAFQRAVVFLIMQWSRPSSRIKSEFLMTYIIRL